MAACIASTAIYQRVVATTRTTVVKCRFRWAKLSQIPLDVIHCSHCSHSRLVVFHPDFHYAFNEIKWDFCRGNKPEELTSVSVSQAIYRSFRVLSCWLFLQDLINFFSVADCKTITHRWSLNSVWMIWHFSLTVLINISLLNMSLISWLMFFKQRRGEEGGRRCFWKISSPTGSNYVKMAICLRRLKLKAAFLQY